jgi:hypothetical protein
MLFPGPCTQDKLPDIERPDDARLTATAGFNEDK